MHKEPIKARRNETGSSTSRVTTRKEEQEDRKRKKERDVESV